MGLSVHASLLIIQDLGGNKKEKEKENASFTIILHVRHLASTAGGKQ